MNEIATDATGSAHLLKFDSVHGTWAVECGAGKASVKTLTQSGTGGVVADRARAVGLGLPVSGTRGLSVVVGGVRAAGFGAVVQTP